MLRTAESIVNFDRRLTVQVGIAAMAFCGAPGGVLMTCGLGSCIAVVLYDPVRRAGGLLHLSLPNSKLAPDKAAANPAMFADTGLPMLFEGMYERGSRKADLVVKLAGGARVLASDDGFSIGERNHLACRKILWKNSVLIASEDVGGTISRTVRLHVDDGTAVVRSAGTEWHL